LKNRIFGGYVISMIPNLLEMLEGVDVDLRLKFGPLSALYSASTRPRKIIVFGGWPQTRSSVPKIFRSVL